MLDQLCRVFLCESPNPHLKPEPSTPPPSEGELANEKDAIDGRLNAGSHEVDDGPESVTAENESLGERNRVCRNVAIRLSDERGEGDVVPAD